MVPTALPGGGGGGGGGGLSAPVTNGNLALMPANTFKVNNTGAPAVPSDATVAAVKILLAIATGDISGLAAIAASGSASDLVAGVLPAGRFPAFTGDVTTVAGTLATILKNTGGGAAGPIGGASTVPVVTVDAQGRVTGLTSAGIAIAAGAVSGLAALATSGSAADLIAGTILAARMPAFTGDVTNSAGTLALTIAAHAVVNGDLAQMANKTYKGRHTAGTGDVEDVSVANLFADLSGAAGADFNLNGKGITNARAAAATGELARWDELVGVYDVKGDILVGTANDAFTRKPVGADGTQLFADSTQAGGIKWAASTSFTDAVFGTGADVNVTIGAGTTTLTRSMQYNNLIMTGNIDAAGFIVSVRGALTGGGTISNAGNGSTGATANFFGGGTSGGTGGTTSGGNSSAIPGTKALGSRGGAGGLGSSGAGGTAGTVSQLAVGDNGVTIAAFASFDPLWLKAGRVFGTGSSPLAFFGGTGGGGGGGDGASGGNGGGGGGVMLVFAHDASGFTGTISAAGANGGNGGGTNEGGGGGGGGGAAFLITNVIPTGSYTVTAAAGAGGTKTGTGVAGTAGSAGVAATLSLV